MEYFQPYPTLIRAVGLKVFYQFSEDLPYRQLYDDLKKDKELRVIHLERENALKQYISELQAWEKRAWTQQKALKHQEKIIIDLTAFETHLKKQKQQKMKCLEDFKQQQLISISYESLVADPTNVLKQVQEFLGVPNRKLFTVMQQQSIQPLARLIENVEEVKAAYPKFLAD